MMLFYYINKAEVLQMVQTSVLFCNSKYRPLFTVISPDKHTENLPPAAFLHTMVLKKTAHTCGLFEKGILSEMILFYLQSFLNSSATNCTFVPMITCTAVLLGRITPATPADLIFFSSTAV